MRAHVACMPGGARERGPLPEKEARRFFQQLILAVDYLLQLGGDSRQALLAPHHRIGMCMAQMSC